MPSAGKKFVVIHGHFYQPPRENPWTEAIEQQETAAPYHDWNERIANECYIPNAIARVVEREGRIVDLVNNYEHISFNFGPTLLSWYERAYPRDYQRILEADKKSGGAIAQAYNHMILPLANPRDRITQVRWGLVDFRKRFGREAEAIWLPETAVHEEVLGLLAEEGMKFVILAPTQAEKVRKIGEETWHDVSHQTVDPRRPYRIPLPGGKQIDAFFYHGPLAQAVSFEKLMATSQGAAERILAAFDPEPAEDQIVSIATDGETYGHHMPFADMSLAYLLQHELPRRGVEVTRYATYLRDHPPQWEVKIKNDSSWSCAHGVSRWKADCSCGSAPGKHTKWRGPMREALDFLRDRCAEIFSQEGGKIFRDPWTARNAYIQVILDHSEDNRLEFLSSHLRDGGGVGPETRRRAWKLLELQRHCLLMYTSCGWFFQDISGLEAVQVLYYAARALQLARELDGNEIEERFLSLLEKAPGNFAEFGNGRIVYEKLVQSRIVEPERVAAHQAMATLLEETPEESRLHHYRFRRLDLNRRTLGDVRLALGRLWQRSGITEEELRLDFLAALMPDGSAHAWLRPSGADEEYREVAGRLERFAGEDLVKGLDPLRAPYFPEREYTLEDLWAEDRRRLLDRVLTDRLEKVRHAYDALWDEFAPLLARYDSLGLPPPPVLLANMELGISQRLTTRLEEIQDHGDPAHLEEIRPLLALGKKWNLQVASPHLEWIFAKAAIQMTGRLELRCTAEAVETLRTLVDIGLDLGLKDWRYRVENRLFLCLREQVYPRLDSPKPEITEEERKIFKGMLSLAGDLHISVGDYPQRLAKGTTG